MKPNPLPCSTCGPVLVFPRTCVLSYCVGMLSGTVTFTCPRCDLPQIAPANLHLACLLVAEQARVIRWTAPAELHETHEGEAICADDLIAFHESLDEELARLLEAS